MTFLDQVFLDNRVRDWLSALGLAAAIFLSTWILRRVLVRRLEKTGTAKVVAAVMGRTGKLFLLGVAIWGGSMILDLPVRVRDIIGTAAKIALFLQAAAWGSAIALGMLARVRERRGAADPEGVTTLGAIAFLARVALWAVALLLILDNLGVDVTALVAGFGIGGIAVALAVQNILADLFASLSIVLDKPFVVGDFIIVGDLLGTVERIGIKTTRVRSLSGEQLVFSNGDLLGSRIRNFKRMYERRVVFALGVVYQTPPDKLEAISRMLSEIVRAQADVRFDRAHFKSFGDFSLNYEIVYYVLSPDYNKSMDIQESINLAIARRFAAEGIEFAYPTQTLFLSNRP
jgi:small-conductance mechanosensitive channel